MLDTKYRISMKLISKAWRRVGWYIITKTIQYNCAWLGLSSRWFSEGNNNWNKTGNERAKEEKHFQWSWMARGKNASSIPTEKNFQEKDTVQVRVFLL